MTVTTQKSMTQLPQLHLKSYETYDIEKWLKTTSSLLMGQTMIDVQSQEWSV